MDDTPDTLSLQPHIVARLRRRLAEVRAMGFQIRQEVLEGKPGTWCEIAGRKTVFIDASQPAIEQLAALNEAVRSYRPAA